MSDDATADFLAREREALGALWWGEHARANNRAGDDADLFGSAPAAPSAPAGLSSFPDLGMLYSLRSY